MEEQFNLYWTSVPNKDADVHFELEQYLAKPVLDSDIPRIFKPSTYKFIITNLIEHPFPMCDIVHCLPPSVSSHIFYEALQYYADLSTSEISAKKHQLYSLLVSASLTEKWLEKCEAHLFDTLFQRIDPEECIELPMVLATSKHLPLNKAYLNYVHRQSLRNPYTKEAIFYLATQRNTHFLEMMASDDYEANEPESLTNVIQLLRIGMMIDNAHTKVTNFNRYDEICKKFELNIDPKQLNAPQLTMYTEFNRILSLYKFIRNNRQYEYQCDTIPVRSFAATYNIIDFLFEFNSGSILSTTSDYALVRRQLVANEQFNKLISPDLPNSSPNKISELHLYDQFYAVDLLYELLTMKQNLRNYDELVGVKCREIGQVIDGIDDSCAFVGAIDALLAVLFVRWEHVQNDSFNRSDNNFSSITTIDESDTFSNDTADHKKPPKVPTSKTGFVCSFTVLQHALGMFEKSMAKHKLSTEDEETRTKFEQCKNEVAVARWKFSIVDSYYNAISCVPIPKAMKLLFTSFHPRAGALKEESSDEDNDGPSTSDKTTPILRRKLRRRTSLQKATINEIDPNYSFAHSTEIDKSKASTFDMPNVSIIRNDKQIDRRGFMNKMLGANLDMATMCMYAGNYAEAQRIIEEKNLKETALASDLQFLQRFNELKDQLKKHMTSSPPLSPEGKRDSDYSVAEIRDLVAHGFESSQIVSALEQFIATHPIEQSPETRALLERFLPNYPYLEQFIGSALQATTVVDFIISQTSNADRCSNLYNLLPRICDKFESMDGSNNIGYFNTIRQFIASLSLYNSHRNQSLGMQDFLTSHCYSFNPEIMSKRFKQEDMLEQLVELPLSTFDTTAGIKETIAKFEIFGRKDENLLSHVYNYSIYLNRLIELKPNAQPSEPIAEGEVKTTNLGKILETDLDKLIGDIVFDPNRTISLPELEVLCNNLNTNLTHVIAKNTCPDISIRDKSGIEPEERLNDILKLLIDGECSSDEPTVVKGMNDVPHTFHRGNREVLDFVRGRSELLAYLLAEIHGVKLDDEENLKIDCTVLKNMLKMDSINIRTVLPEKSNRMVAALEMDIFDWASTKELIRRKEYWSAFRLVDDCPGVYRKRHEELIDRITDQLIAKILEKALTEKEEKHYTLIQRIKDVKLMTNTLLQYIGKISDDEMALHLTRVVLLHDRVSQIEPEQKASLEKYLDDIVLFADIGKALTHLPPHDSWTKIAEITRIVPENLLYSLIERNQFDLCDKWLRITSIPPEPLVKPSFIELLIRKVHDEEITRTESFVSVCKNLLTIMVLQLNTALLMEIRNRELLDYLIDFLIGNSLNPNPIYLNYKVSLSILDVVKPEEAASLWELISDPLLIIEQFVMNTKFEAVQRIIDTVRTLIQDNECKFCSNVDESDVFAKINSNAQLYKQFMSDFSALKSAYIGHPKNQFTSIECINRLLRIYAAKSLDFRVDEGPIEMASQFSGTSSLDSLCGTFMMPREPPDRANWVKDAEASMCMGCRRSVFTMLTRRHHCRRCGRVVCASCSSNRLIIPKLYADIPVRSCDDCVRQSAEREQKQSASPQAAAGLAEETQVLPETSFESTGGAEANTSNSTDLDVWIYRFSGHIKHDNLVRDEFSFEYAPSASLCLSILAMHTPGQQVSDFLLSFCRKFESLLKPLKPGQSNPEIDYPFVTRLLSCLSLAAKVHGNTAECLKVRDHADIINSVVRNGCESLLPMDSINTESLRTLRDNLVINEKWNLAIDISLKCGLQKTGVMAAWGMSLIKAGCFETAREKFQNCLTRTISEEDRREIIEFLTADEAASKNAKKTYNFRPSPQPPKTQALLLEIITVLEATCHPLPNDVIQKASAISQSNRLLASHKTRKKESLPIHEPAVNILHTLSNLQQVSMGNYSIKTHRTIEIANLINENGNALFASDSDYHGPHSRFYSEAIFYLVSYGRHIDILHFLVKYKQVAKALKYTLQLQVPWEQFQSTIILPHLKSGRLNVIIQQMIDMDVTLLQWKEYIMQTCLMLEKRNFLNSLYQVQLLLKDTVRASMTCVRFYSMGCASYQDLKNNAHHLMAAQKHLKSELELCQWEEIKTQTRRVEDTVILVMKMDSKSLNQHINTIWLQIDAAKFLAQCEENGKETANIIYKISLVPCAQIPTLFGTAQDKIILSALILICGTNVEEGFGLSYRIIHDLSLNVDKIYAIASKFFALNNRLPDVQKLIECINSNSAQADHKLCDEIISLAVQTALGYQSSLLQSRAIIEHLIRLINDIPMRIDCHILSGQLKAAYLLAVQHKRTNDIRRIHRQAEKSNQIQIRKLCEKKLQSVDTE